MTTTTTTPLTVRQRALLEAIDAGITTLRDLMDVADYSSISTVKHHLDLLAERGMVALETYADSDRVRAFSGREFCAAWDSACRLSGNPEA